MAAVPMRPESARRELESEREAVEPKADARHVGCVQLVDGDPGEAALARSAKSRADS